MLLGGLALLAAHGWGHAAESKPPVILAIDAEFGVSGASSAQAIQRGAEIAADEINAAGGVLGGRPLQVVVRNNNSVPARAQDNLRELAKNADVVAVMGGKHSTVVQQLRPLIHELGMPYLVPWAAADDVTDNQYAPNFVFRLSLRDSWAVATLLRAADARGLRRIGMVLPNNGWGRSNRAAAERLLETSARLRLVSVQWYNAGDTALATQYEALLKSGAEVIVLAANEVEGAALVAEIASRPDAARLPVLSHWGITGGDFFRRARNDLQRVDVSVVQTYSFINAHDARAKQVQQQLRSRYGVATARDIASPVGVAQAYDLTHLLAIAIRQAGSTDRAAIRDALERIRNFRGLVRHYRQPFATDRHDALDAAQPFMARYAPDGAIVRAK